MSHDAENPDVIQGSPYPPPPSPHPRDLETLVTLLEVATIDLTPEENSQFTKSQLIDRAKEIAGGTFKTELVDLDFEIVLKSCNYLLRKHPNGKYSLR